MPIFSYKAVDMDGNRREGRVEKNSPGEAAEFVTAAGYIPLEIRRYSILNADLSEIKFLTRGVGKKDIALFCRQLWFVLSSGLEITAAFRLLSSLTPNRDFRDTLTGIYDQLQKGESLSGCMGKYGMFPDMLAGMVRIGELSGSLPSIMEKMAEHYEKEYKTSEELVNAMIYPLAVSLMMLVVIVIAVVFVVPSYAQVFIAGGLELPLPTRMLIGVSNFVTRFYGAILVLSAAAAIAGYLFLKSPTGRRFVCYSKLRLPIVRGVYIKLVNLRFSQTMGLMLDSGQQMVASLESVKRVLSNVVLDCVIDEMIIKIEEGSPLWPQMETIPYFDSILSGMTRIGEETGMLADTMTKCADYFQREADSMILRLNKMIEPAVTIILGILLALIMLAVMLPTFSMIDIM